jgi:hypothetical protein
LQQLRSALEFFRSDKTTYPAVNVGAWGNVSLLDTSNPNTGLVSTYMDAIPVGITNPYIYVQTNSGYGYCLAAKLDNVPSVSATCSVAFPAGYSTYNYVVKNP